MIQTEGITKSFGSLQVLKGIDLTIGEGEIVAIVGPSGAGKTTLLQIIGTLDAPDNGKLYINGTERTVRRRETARSRCPRPYQQPVRHPCRRTVGKPGYQKQGRTAQALLRPARPDAPDIRDRHARRAVGNRYGPRDPYQRRNGSIDN